MITLQELKAKLAAQYDEVGLLDILEVDTEELVEVFEDKINDRYEYYLGKIEELYDETE